MTTANEGSEHGRPLCLALTDLLGLLDEWAKASGTHFAARSAGLQTTDTVSRDDLLQLMRAVEAAERERCAGICDALAITVELKYERILRIAASRILGA